MAFFDIVGGPAARFGEVGDSVTGVVTQPYETRAATEFGTDRPKLSSKGRPMEMAVITLQTDERDPEIDGDDGIRVLYADKWLQRKAIAAAVHEAGARDVEVGGRLTVTWAGEENSGKGNPTKTWTASYVRANSIMGAVEPAATPAVSVPVSVPVSAPVASTPAASTSNGNASNDIVKIREMAKLGFDAESIHKVLPTYSRDAIVAAMQT